MRIEIDEDHLRDELTYRLDREPTEDELEEFKDYIKRDIPQWITDNAKSFVRD